MHFSVLVLASLAGLSAVQAQSNAQQRTQGSNNNPQTSLSLERSQIQTGLASNGQDPPTEGQSPSLTSGNNFINFCLTRPDLPLTNGKQIATGSCNPTPMGVIVAQDKIPTVKFQSPKNFGNVAALQTFDIVLKVRNIQAGSFVNPQTNYYGAPGQTNAQGIAIGHIHFTMQKLASIDSTELLDNSKFAFFKGVNGAQDAQGNVQATVTNGVEAGAYRICTIVSYSNHQGILPAIAQRGSMDDCIYITVGGSDGVDGDEGDDSDDGDGQAPASTANGNNGQSSSTTTSSGVSTTTSSATSQPTTTGRRRGGSRFRNSRQRQGSNRFQRPQRRSHHELPAI